MISPGTIGMMPKGCLDAANNERTAMSCAVDDSLNEEAPNELIINRRSFLNSGVGLLLVPVTGLLGSASAQEPNNINAFADKLLYDFSKVCRVATQAEVGPYYIDKA